MDGTDFRLKGEPGELLSEVEGACVADVPYGGANPGGVPEPGGVGGCQPGDEVQRSRGRAGEGAGAAGERGGVD